MPNIPPDRFRFLVAQQIRSVKQDLDDYARNLNTHKWNFLSDALNTPVLVERFAPTIEQLVSVAVCAELHRLSKSRILYQALNIESESEMAQALRIEQVEDALARPEEFARAHPVDLNVNHEQAYNRYYNWILGARPPQGLGPKRPFYFRRDRVDAFYNRNPIARHIIEFKSRFFIESIIEACDRIYDDREAIRVVFFKDVNVRLTDIQTTGSDSHKRGRQVLILRFEDDANQKYKLVYKPSDVEIDYRIVGSADRRTRRFLEANDNIRYVSWHKSLSAIINEALREETLSLLTNIYGEAEAEANLHRLELPTYRVLPCNPGSKLTLKDNRWDIGLSYGYIEYLTHTPDFNLPPYSRSDIPLLKQAIRNGIVQLRQKDPHAIADSDWIATDPEAPKLYCRLWGRLMGLAYLAGITDLHSDNQRVFKQRPCLIDLESSLDSVVALEESSIAQFYGKEIIENLNLTLSNPKGIEVSGHPIGSLVLGETQSREYTPLVWYFTFEWFNSTNTMYSYPEAEREPKHIDPLRTGKQRETFRGVKDVLALARPPSPVYDRIYDSIGKTNDVIVRHVPEGTPEFVCFLWHSYELMLLEGIGTDVPRRELPQIHRRAIKDLAKRRINSTRRAWEEKDQGNYVWDRPFFALESDGNSWADYENFDVPYYCRRLGSRSTDILNARGEIVDLAKAKENQDTIDGVDRVNRPVDEFFPEHMPNHVLRVLRNLNLANDVNFHRREKTLMFGLFKSGFSRRRYHPEDIPTDIDDQTLKRVHFEYFDYLMRG